MVNSGLGFAKCWSGGGTSSKSSPGSNLKQWVIIAAACSVCRAAMQSQHTAPQLTG